MGVHHSLMNSEACVQRDWTKRLSLQFFFLLWVWRTNTTSSLCRMPLVKLNNMCKKMHVCMCIHTARRSNQMTEWSRQQSSIKSEKDVCGKSQMPHMGTRKRHPYQKTQSPEHPPAEGLDAHTTTTQVWKARVMEGNTHSHPKLGRGIKETDNIRTWLKWHSPWDAFVPLSAHLCELG